MRSKSQNEAGSERRPWLRSHFFCLTAADRFSFPWDRSRQHYRSVNGRIKTSYITQRHMVVKRRTHIFSAISADFISSQFAYTICILQVRWIRSSDFKHSAFCILHSAQQMQPFESTLLDLCILLWTHKNRTSHWSGGAPLANMCVLFLFSKNLRLLNFLPSQNERQGPGQHRLSDVVYHTIYIYIQAQLERSLACSFAFNMNSIYCVSVCSCVGACTLYLGWTQ